LSNARRKAARAIIDFLIKTTKLERGQMSEQRVFAAVQAWKDRPSWMSDFVKSTPEEDQIMGVDAWVETTDVGRIPIQIKSSDVSRVLFEEGSAIRGRALENRPHVVVVRPDITDEAICRCILTGARYLRDLRLVGERKTA
jgi:hypothetical protein